MALRLLTARISRNINNVMPYLIPDKCSLNHTMVPSSASMVPRVRRASQAARVMEEAPRKLTSKEHIALEHKYSAHNCEPLPVVLSRGKGALVWDVEGKQYIDCLASYACVNQGHSHPKIIDALETQAQKMTLSSRAFYNDALGEYAKFLTEYFGYERMLPMNTGVEAWETACKLARRWAYDVKGVPQNKARLVFAAGCFHGRTIAAVSASSDPNSFGGFGPYVANFDKIPFNDLEAVEKAVSDPNVAAYVCEPIQGEGGVIVPTEGYIAKVAEICNKHNVLFVADEVQTGCGRTGKLLACDYDNVKPDILILAKAVSGGVLPVSAVLARDDIMLTIRPGQHGSTYGGNALAARVSMAALTVLREEGMIENSFAMGELFRTKLRALNSPLIKEVRGRGLMNAIVMKPTDAGETASDVVYRLKDNGLLSKSAHGVVIRLSPPLVINKAQVEQAVDIIGQTLKSFE